MDNGAEDAFSWSVGTRQEFGIKDALFKEAVHGEFILKGHGGVKKYIFAPPGSISDPNFIDSVMRLWELNPPNLIIELSDCTTNPVSHIQPLDFETSDDFKCFRDAQEQEVSSPLNRGQFTIAQVNSIFHDRLVDVVGRVSTAADANNAWFLQRSANVGTSMLLGEGMERMGATPVVLAVLDPSGEAYGLSSQVDVRELFTAKSKSRSMTAQLLHAAKPLKERAVNTIVLDATRDDLVFAMNQANTWANDDFRQKSSAGQRPWLAMDDKRGWLTSFDTVYPLWMTANASHYIFAMDIASFDPTCLAPTGYLLCGGEDKRKVWHSIQRELPMIVLSHTYGIAGEYDRVLSMAKKKRAECIDDSSKMFVARQIHEEKNTAELVYFKDIAETMRILDSVIDNPGLFEDVVVTANALTENPDVILDRLSNCFASAHNRIREVGSGSADEKAVAATWRLHRMLEVNVQVQGRRHLTMLFLSLFMTFASTAVTVGLVILQDLNTAWAEDLRASKIWWTLIKYTAIVVPALSTLINTIVLTLNFSGKWASLKMASAKLLSTIYLFRGRVGIFSAVEMKRAPVRGAGSKAVDLSNDNQSVIAHHTRARFTAEVQGIFSRVQETEMGQDHLHEQRAGIEIGDVEEGQTPLLQHVMSAKGVTDQGECGMLSTEEYVNSRMLTLLRWAQGESRWAFRLLLCLRIGIFFVGSSATVVVAFGLPKWAPLIVALSTTMAAISHNLNLAARLQGLNDMILTLRSNMLFWHSATIIEKRLPHIRASIISSTEQSHLSMTSAWTGGLSSLGQNTAAAAPDADGMPETLTGQKSSAKANAS